MTEQRLKVTYRKVDDLVPYARNARLHSDAQVAALADSIKRFGFNVPVAVDGDNGVIAGHARVMAAKIVALAKVPCVELSHLTAEQKRAYVLADNKLAERSSWDKGLLALELSELRAVGVDLTGLGFEAGELDGLLASTTDQAMPQLPRGDRRPFQQMTFTVHDAQVEDVKRALEVAKSSAPFEGSPNKNANGNALHRICQTFLAARAHA